ncbi:hypothetical protein [Caballeronia udeis]|uniref:hypothetical protein n=1 Tax=Caballeronia udeis TaxID=1232866 RepID=UPI00078161C2|nr:hypothetical protein [Caballeronia udeis]
MVFLSMFYKYSCAARAFSKVLTPAISSLPLQPVAFSCYAFAKATGKQAAALRIARHAPASTISNTLMETGLIQVNTGEFFRGQRCVGKCVAKRETHLRIMS